MKRKLQVFVSSTYADLIDERQAAVSAILKAGHIPAGMELFTAGDRSQMKTIERWIDESDVYMLILGGRYGSIEPSTGLSYTELEYDYAVEQGKRLFATVISEGALEKKIKEGGSKFLEQQEPKALQQFRTKALSNISSFFSDPRDVRLCVYESLSDFAADPDLKGWVSAAEVEDVSSLHAEIGRLREENEKLANEVQAFRRADQATIRQSLDTPTPEESDLIDLLKAIEVKIPENLAKDGKEVISNLLNIAYNNKDILINGITNEASCSDIAQFYYFNILPKLQAHGLAENEKVAGARYRRSFLNKKGQALFAAIEKRALLKKKKKETVSDTEELASNPSPSS